MILHFLKNTFFFSILLLGGIAFTGSSLSAQNVKIGYLKYNEMLVNLPEIAEADEEIKQLTGTWDNRIEEEYTKFQAKFQQYMNMAEQGLLSPREIQEKDEELDKDREALMALQMTMEQQIREKRRELLSPLLRTLEQAVKEIAEENGYNYILDAGAGDLLFFDEANDVGPKVEKRYRALRVD